MRAFILIGFFVIIHTTVFSQEYISGKVVEENGEPLHGAIICLGNSRNCQVSDENGEFRILKPNIKGMTMSITCMGYEPVKIENIDTISYPIIITMEGSLISLIEYPPYSFAVSLQVDVLNHSFNNFESILGRENIDNLNKLGGIISFDYALWYRKFYFAFNFGGSEINSLELDSVDAVKGDYKIFLLGTHFGYNIVNSRSFIFTPKIGVKWYRYRMLNYDSERRIPMGQYITNRDLDIRFNHLIGFAGLNCTYLLKEQVFPPIAIGLYGGYAFKLNDKTWVYSRNNRLTTDHKIEFGNFNFGVTLSLIFKI